MTDTSISSRPGPLDHAFVLAANLEIPRELESIRQHFLRMRTPYAVRNYILGGRRRAALDLMQEPAWWPEGRLSPGYIANIVLLMMPRGLALALRFVKHALRARLRRNDALYVRFVAARARLSAAFHRGAAPKVQSRAAPSPLIQHAGAVYSGSHRPDGEIGRHKGLKMGCPKQLQKRS
jgi:hypothetical protein